MDGLKGPMLAQRERQTRLQQGKAGISQKVQTAWGRSITELACLFSVEFLASAIRGPLDERVRRNRFGEHGSRLLLPPSTPTQRQPQP